MNNLTSLQARIDAARAWCAQVGETHADPYIHATCAEAQGLVDEIEQLRAENADDSLSVTEEWFRSIGATDDDNGYLLLGPVWWYRCNAGEWVILDMAGGFDLKTRGPVRRLLQAIGYERKSQSGATIQWERISGS